MDQVADVYQPARTGGCTGGKIWLEIGTKQTVQVVVYLQGCPERITDQELGIGRIPTVFHPLHEIRKFCVIVMPDASFDGVF